LNALDCGNVRRLHRLVCAIASFILVCAAPVLVAQTFDATNLRKPADLDSPWLVNAADDPAYARPDFDDSQWTLFDPHKQLTSVLTQSRPEVVWYRLRVKVSPDQTGHEQDRSELILGRQRVKIAADQSGLALREQLISSAFEIYVNGERLIASGRMTPYVGYTANARILAPIPDRLLATGTLLIAMRVHLSKIDWSGQNPGFYATNLTIGQQSTLYRDDWLAIIGENSLDWLDRTLTVCLGLVALVLFSAQRRNTEYLWIAAAGLLTLLELPQPVISSFTNIPIHWQALAALLRLCTPYVLAGVYFSFVHQRLGWRWRIFLIFTGITNAYSGLQGILFTPPPALQAFTNLPLVVLFSVILPIVLAIHWRRGNREAGILLIPIVLFSLYIYAEITFGVLFQIPGWHDFALRGLNMIDRFPAGPISLSLNSFSGIMSTISLALIMLIRSTRMNRRQAILEGELAAAQQVQQVLLPEQTESVPGFAVETVYQPAQQVGGDFFQILPDGEGGLLAVVGDVAGKGLPAAMLVSVLVGAIRGVAEYTSDPAELLASLNERLVGRGGGSFSTASVAHIKANGQVTIANAGHLSPYLDGREVELPGALPLGVMSDAVYATTEFYLAPGSRLTFYSDGVVEAQNQKGELFGFDRAKAISTQPAAAIVDAAKQFGQEDDITVVTIVRQAAVASAA
jgi:sigma-B regulation protein RsbU (phosphoserine phosphatase)